MNQMKGDIEHMLWYDSVEIADLSGYRTAVWRSDRPCTVKGQKDCIWPQEAMLDLLGECSTQAVNSKLTTAAGVEDLNALDNLEKRLKDKENKNT